MLAEVEVLLYVHRNRRLIRDGEKEGRGMEVGGRDTVTTRMTCIKMGSDESRFNVSLIVSDKVTGEGQSHKTVQRPQLLKKNESRNGFKPRSTCLTA